MKGFIAAFTAVAMTGMVIGQQPQGSANLNSAGSQFVPKQFVSAWNDELIANLKKYGEMEADIDPRDRDSVVYVVLQAEGSENRQFGIKPFVINKRVGAANSDRLEFLLTDSLIEMMYRTGLRYTLSEDEIGRYKKVVVYYDNNSLGIKDTNNTLIGAAQPSGSRRMAGDQNSFDPDSAPNFSTASRQENQFSAGESVAIDPRLELPTKRQPDWMQVPNSTTSYDGRVNTRPATPWDMAAAQNQNPARNEPVDFPTRTTNRFEPLGTRSTDLVAQPAPVQTTTNNDVLVNYLQTLAEDKDKLTQIIREQQHQMNLLENKLENSKQASANQTAELQRLALDRDLAYAARARTDLDYPTSFYPNRTWQDNGTQLVSATDADLNQVPTYPDRVAALPQPSQNPPPLGINGPTDSTSNASRLMAKGAIDQQLLLENSKLRKQSGALWFIMFCSIGLNAYLSWIARGFYVRYEELADEIRESFTSNN
jgi:hypothetical protein